MAITRFRDLEDVSLTIGSVSGLLVAADGTTSNATAAAMRTFLGLSVTSDVTFGKVRASEIYVEENGSVWLGDLHPVTINGQPNFTALASFTGGVAAIGQVINLDGSTVYGAVTFAGSLILDGVNISAAGLTFTESPTFSDGLTIGADAFLSLGDGAIIDAPSASWRGALIFDSTGSGVSELQILNGGSLYYSGAAGFINFVITGTPTSTTPLTFGWGDARYAPITQTKTSGFQASAGNRYKCVGTFTVTPPASGTLNDEIEFVIEGSSSAVTILGTVFVESDLSVIARYNGSVWVLVPRQFNRDVTSFGKILTPSRVGQIPVSGELLNLEQARGMFVAYGPKNTVLITTASDTTYRTIGGITLTEGKWVVMGKCAVSGPLFANHGTRVKIALSNGSVTVDGFSRSASTSTDLSTNGVVVGSGTEGASRSFVYEIAGTAGTSAVLENWGEITVPAGQTCDVMYQGSKNPSASGSLSGSLYGCQVFLTGRRVQ